MDETEDLEEVIDNLRDDLEAAVHDNFPEPTLENAHLIFAAFGASILDLFEALGITKEEDQTVFLKFISDIALRKLSAD